MRVGRMLVAALFLAGLAGCGGSPSPVTAAQARAGLDNCATHEGLVSVTPQVNGESCGYECSRSIYRSEALCKDGTRVATPWTREAP